MLDEFHPFLLCYLWCALAFDICRWKIDEHVDFWHWTRGGSSVFFICSRIPKHIQITEPHQDVSFSPDAMLLLEFDNIEISTKDNMSQNNFDGFTLLALVIVDFCFHLSFTQYWRVWQPASIKAVIITHSSCA